MNGSDQPGADDAGRHTPLDCGCPPVESADKRDGNCVDCGGLACLTKAISDGELPFLVPQALVSDLAATTKEEAIREIVERLAASGVIDTRELESTTTAIIQREETGSTGIGYGVAIPHISHSSVRRQTGTAARSRRGIDFGSRDGKPVHLIFLLLSPPGSPGDHVRALGAVAQHLRSHGVPA